MARYTRINACALQKENLGLPGLKFSVDVENDSAKVITLEGPGGIVRIGMNYSALEVYVPAPPKTEKKYRLVGTFGEEPIILPKKFDSEREAESWRDENNVPRDFKAAAVEVLVEE